MVLEGLIWVQGTQFAFNNCSGSLSGGLDEVIVNAMSGSVLLNALQEVLSGESFGNLEFFIPVSHCLRVQSIQRHNCLTDFFHIGNLHLRFLFLNPAFTVNLDGSQEVWFRLEDGREVNLEILGKQR